VISWSTFRRRLRTVFERRAVEREMDEELRFHLDLAARAREREGDTPVQARRAAVQQFGGVEAVKEAYRDARGILWVEHLRQDLLYAARTLRRRPLFAGSTAVIIALGIGSATSIYSVVDGVLLRPLPYREPARLVRVWRTFPHLRTEPGNASRWNRIALSLPEFRDLADRATVFDGVAVWLRIRETLVEGDARERVPTIRVSAGLLDLLGVRPIRGRTFFPEEDRPGGPGAVLVSFEAWRTRFGGAENILGRTIHFEDRLYTIVGVLPPELRIGLGGREAHSLGMPAFWIPAGQPPLSGYEERDGRGYEAIARLRRGITLESAEAEAHRILGDVEGKRRIGTRLAPWQEEETRDARDPLLLLLGAAGLLLLVVCVNVATLLSGEAAARRHEIAARLALGAARSRIVRQLVTESLALATLGGALGLVVAAAGTRILVRFAPPELPGASHVVFDLRVAIAALATVAVTGIIFGLVPALPLSRTGPATILRVGAGQSALDRAALQRALVSGEIALSLVLLVGAGLLVHTFRNIIAVDPGFRPGALGYIDVVLPQEAYGIRVGDNGSVAFDSALVQRLYGEAAASLSALPGVTAAVIATTPPFRGRPSVAAFTLSGSAGEPGDARRAEDHAVSPGYFELLGIPMLAGREFAPIDRWGAPNVVIVNAALARRDLSGASPIGRRVLLHGQWRTIVGVVADVHAEALTQPAEPALYTPFAQRGDVLLPSVVVRYDAVPPSASIVRETLAHVDPRLILTARYDAGELMERTYAEERFRALLISLFGVLAALFSAIGMYGVTARAVARRMRDVGIRLALGASGGSVVRLLMRHTFVGVAVGVACGVVLAFASARALSPFLFGVTASDPSTYVAIVTLLVAAATLATWVPARRLRRLNVIAVLRAE
jgi:predicted permease